MAGHLNGIRHHDAVTKLTVVTQVAIGHQQVAIPNHRAFAFLGGAIDGDAFTNRVAVADHHLRRSTSVFEVLRFQAEASPRENTIVATQAESSIEHDIGPDPAVRADRHLWAHDRARSDDNTRGQFSLGIHHRSGMDLSRRAIRRHPDQSTRENISSPEQARSPSTVASALTLPKRLRLRLSSSQRITS